MTTPTRRNCLGGFGAISVGTPTGDGEWETPNGSLPLLAQSDQSVRHGVRFDQHVKMVSGQFGIRPTKSLRLGRGSLVCLIQAESQVRTRRIGPPVFYGDDLLPESQRLGSNLLE